MLDVYLLIKKLYFLLDFLIFTKFYSFTSADGHSSCAWYLRYRLNITDPFLLHFSLALGVSYYEVRQFLFF